MANTMTNIPGPSLWITYSLLVALLLLALFVLFNKRTSTSQRNAILLVGAPDAGKTAILTTLLYNETRPTITSLQTNLSVVGLPNGKTIRIIDVPGHPRVRDQFGEHLSVAKAVAFVVDSSTVSRNGASVAEHLHIILHALTSLPPSRSPPALLIVAHKADVLKSPSTPSPMTSDSLVISRVKTVLERELEKRRASQLGGVGVEGLGEEGERSDMGGLECNGSSSATFRFSDWEGGEVGFVASSVSVGVSSEADGGEEDGDGLAALREWLQK